MNSMHRLLQLVAAFAVLSVGALAFQSQPVLAASLTSNASSGFVGSTLRLTSPALSFPANSAGTLEFAAGTQYRTSTPVSSDNTGALSASIVIPSAPASTYQITAQIGGNSGTVSFTVKPGITVSPFSLAAGDRLTVSCAGFSAGAMLSMTIDSVLIWQGTANAYGTLEQGGFVMPPRSFGPHSLAVTDGTNSVYATLTVQPRLSITPTACRPGDNVTVSGTGFGQTKTVTLVFGGLPLSKFPVTNGQGIFSASFVVPGIASRTAVLSADDGLARLEISVNLTPVIRVSPASGSPGGRLSVSGDGFASGRTLGIAFDGAVVATVVTGQTGSFATDLAVPAAESGEHAFSIQDDLGDVGAAFVVSPLVSLDPPTAQTGSRISVAGAGLRSNRDVAVSVNGIKVISAATDSKGSFSGAFVVPPLEGGAHGVTADDGSNSLTSNLVIAPVLVLSPESGPMGISVQVSGTGFSSNTTVTIDLDKSQSYRSTTDTSGTFHLDVSTLGLQTGPHTFSARDRRFSAEAGYVVSASMRVDPQSCNVGDLITVTCSGLTSPISVLYDGQPVAADVPGTENVFVVTFTAPPSIHGGHSVKATDGKVTLEATLSMDATAPPAPSGLRVTGRPQGSRPGFSWLPVSDPSGVTYTLQVAADASFRDIVLLKPDLKTHQYNLQGGESLKSTGKAGVYYWRVKAVDFASNESIFSSPVTFSVSVIPPWLFVLLIVTGVIIVAFLVLWARSRAGHTPTSHTLPPT
jgi:hypothetical protein